MMFLKKSALAVIPSALVLAGCYPMEQAPLVYASKATVGLGLTAGTPENPGLELAIGYKTTDVALVPVAVAKYCKLASGTECLNAIYAIEIITGSKVDTVDNGIMDKAIQDIKLQLANAVNQSKTLANAITPLEISLQKFEDRKRILKTLAELPDAVADESPEISSQRAQLQADLAQTDSVSNLNETDVRNQRASLSQQKKDAEIEIGELQKQVAGVMQRIQAAETGSRGDSLSVYGTFQGGGQGDTQGGSLAGGKVFATGIAAQNLSEYAGASDCLASIAILASKMEGQSVEQQRNDLLASAATVCAPRQNK